MRYESNTKINYSLDDGVLWFATRSVCDMKPLLLGQVYNSNPWLPSGEEFAEVSWVRGLLDQMIDLSANTQGHPLLDPLQLLLQSDENPLRHLVSGLSLSTRGCGVVAGLPCSVKERCALFPWLLPSLKVHGL